MADNVMKDIIDRELAIGNTVAFALSSSHYMDIGRIIKFTPKMVRVEYRAYGNSLDSVLRYPWDLVLLDGPELVEYLLKRS